MEEENLNLNVLDNLVPDEETAESSFDSKAIEEIENTEVPPAPFSEEWHDYVMREFLDEELEGGSPVRDGLVRVTEKLIGPIYKREIVSYTAPESNNRWTSTVHIRIHINVTNEQHPLKYGNIEEDGIAEVNLNNTPDTKFSLHPLATASSKAEAQALRKILRLRRMVAADEKSPEGTELETAQMYEPEEPISNEQINIIDLLCKRTNMSVMDFISSGRMKYVTIKQISHNTAQSMIKYLGEIQSKLKDKPQNVKPYDPSWKNEEVE